MFAVLQILEREKDIISRIKEKFKPHEPTISSIAVRSGAPFFIVTTKKTKQGIDWQGVKSVCGRMSQYLLLPSEISLPDGGAMSCFKASILPAKLTLNCAAESLARCEIAASELSVCIVDRKGILSRMIECLVMYASTIKIVTDESKKYSAIASDIMKKYGAALIIDDNIALARNSSVVITADISYLTGKEKGVIFAPQSTLNYRFPNLVTGEEIVMPKEYAQLLPTGIKPLLFASALHELCGVGGLEKTRYDKYYINDKSASIFEISGLLKKQTESGTVGN